MLYYDHKEKTRKDRLIEVCIKMLKKVHHQNKNGLHQSIGNFEFNCVKGNCHNGKTALLLNKMFFSGVEMSEIFHLTIIDKLILESYKNLLDGLAVYLGDGYEFVLHSLSDVDQSVIKIINGFHTGRKEGAPITDMALKMLSQIQENPSQGSISYFTKNKKGEPLKSTTIAIYGESGKVIGLLCINFYLKTPLVDVLSSFISEPEVKNFSVENFVENVPDLIEGAVAGAIQIVTQDQTIISSLKNKQIIVLLYKQGIFKLKNAVDIVANQLKISRNTVYLHLRTLK